MATGNVKILSMAILGATFISLGAGAAAQAATLTFDELPYQPIDDLSFMGVTFDYKLDGIDSIDAYYNDPAPPVPDIININWPALEGNAKGILTLDFTTPVTTLAFGTALSTLSTVTPGFTVELFDPALTSFGSTTVDVDPQPGSPFPAAEGLFSYTGTSVKRAVVDFNENFDTLNAHPDNYYFSVDNLTFTSATSVPEPASITGIIALAILGAGSLIKRKQKQGCSEYCILTRSS